MPLRDLAGRARALVNHAESWWFDRTRNVDTSGNVALAAMTLKGATAECFEYLPSRAATARQALERLPISRHSEYTFVDIGSGKGRILFLAAEYPFRRIQGVEFAAELHRQACENIARYRSPKRRCDRIESVHQNALDYPFPDGNLVLYLFNPFGPAVMNGVLANLEQSLRQHPREIFLTLCFPELSGIARAKPWLAPLEENRRYCLYRSSPR